MSVPVCQEFSAESFRSSDCQFLFSTNILNVNVQSLRSNFDSLEIFANSVTKPFDLICLTETFLYNDEISNYSLNGYHFVGKQRSTRGGGVGVYVRDGAAESFEYSEVDIAGTESLMLELRGGSFGMFGSCLYLTVIYRQPSADTGAFLCDLERHKFSNRNHCHIILGDINIDTLKSDGVSLNYLNILACANFSNVITIPTRINSCIDHINVNFNNQVITSGTIITKIADHLPTFVSFENDSTHVKPTKSIKIRNYRHFVQKKFVNELENVDWEREVYGQSDVNTMYNNFSNCVFEVCGKHAPLEMTKVKNIRTKKPWITHTIIKLINKKDYAYRQTLNSPFNTKLKFKFKTLRNSVRKEIRNSVRKEIREAKTLMFETNF